jgi:biotin operon repressor
MIKSQDIVLLLKLLSAPGHLKTSQNQLAALLCMSVSEVNTGLKRLSDSGLTRDIGPLLPRLSSRLRQLNITAIEEFLLFGVKYVFPAKVGEYTRGIPTVFAAH